MTDALTGRCNMKQTLRHVPDSRDYFQCHRRAEFYIAPVVHPSEGLRACAQHTVKAIRAVMAENKGFPVKVDAIDAESEG